jgi:hypothetical protein
MSIRPGEPWGRPASAAPDRVVDGTDRDLAVSVADAPAGALVSFRPEAGSDIARAVGLNSASARAGTELPMDVLTDAGGSFVACNMVVLGTPPDRLRRFRRRYRLDVRVDGIAWFAGRATTVVCATGQWLRGLDLVPRGHPGDGRAEIQIYRLRPSEPRAMRGRLRGGGHLPHPRILQRTGRRIEVRCARPIPLEVDGATAAAVTALTLELVPARYRLLV